MTPVEYEFLSEFLRDRSGLSLGNDRHYLLKSRLEPLAHSRELDGLSTLVTHLRGGKDPTLESAVVDAMTTNETSFLRDRTPFEEFKSVILPALREARRTTRSIRVWSAACSTGQEPRSLAMMLAESLPDVRSWDIQIVATDISQRVLDRAKAGEYSAIEVQRGLPAQLLVKYFEQAVASYRVRPELRDMIEWRQLNLFDSFTSLGTFDVIFCRNVLIYFEVSDKADILTRLQHQLAPEGCLFLGGAETVLGITDKFGKHPDCKAAVYVPANATARV